MDEPISMVEYVRGVETAEELTRRIYIDDLVNKVHRDHRSISAVQERQSLLQQFIRLPGDPSPNEVPTRPPGEILVSFYNHELPLDSEPDDESGGIDESKESEGVPSQTSQTNPTCQPVPLQYLYNFPSNGAEMINEAELRGLLPQMPGSGANLGVIEFPMTDYAADFLKTMKNISLDSLINNPKSMAKVKTNEQSSFLTGVSYYPRVPPRRLVSSSGRKIIYNPGTMIFIAIPYLGLESTTSALFRRNRPLSQLGTPLPQSGTEQTQDEMANNMAERLTGYHVVDNLATACNSSLSLLEYRYSSKPDFTAPDMWRNAAGETRSELPVVHQMWFMVFDNKTIAAFRSANDIQSENLPLHPTNFQSVGAYHGAINMMSNIMDSSNHEILELFSQIIFDLEVQFETCKKEEVPTVVHSNLKAVKIELLAIITVVKTQIKVLENLRQFELASEKEQFTVMRKTIDKVVGDRKVFCSDIKEILDDLVNIEGGMDEQILKITAKTRDEIIRDQLTLVAKAATEITAAAAESKAAALMSKEAAERVVETSKQAVLASNLAARAAEQSAESSLRTEQTSKLTADAAKATKETSKLTADAADATKETSKLTADAAEASKVASKQSTEQSQGQGMKMTVFTVITTIFTPLNFFTSYLGMNVDDIRNTPWTQQKFWALSAPLSLAIVIFIFIVAFRGKRYPRDISPSEPPPLSEPPPSPVRPNSDLESQTSSTRTSHSWSWAWTLPGTGRQGKK